MAKADNFHKKSHKVSKEKLIKTIQNKFLYIVRLALSDKRAIDRVSILKSKFPGIPNEVLAKTLIKRAMRKTTVAGASSGVVISICDLVLAAPAPEPAHKAAAVAGIGGSIFTDFSYATGVQMQLILDLSELYDCRFDENDEDDIWIIFKAALGLKGIEKVGTLGHILLGETARKQFRILLRMGGIRKAVQDGVIRISGPRIGRYLGEKYVLRIIPGFNIVFGATFNNRITKMVGKWAHIRVKARSSVQKYIEIINQEGHEKRIWVLPIIFYVGTIENKLTDNLLMLYANANTKLNLYTDELSQVEKLINDEELSSKFQESLPNINNESVRKALLNIAISSTAINLKPTKRQYEFLREFAGFLSVNFNDLDLDNRIKYLKRA